MSQYCFETPNGIFVTELRISRHPIVATLTFHCDGIVYDFRCIHPVEIGKITELLQECDQIRVVNLNSKGVCLERGKYRVELWDEDDPCGSIEVDDFEQEAVNTVTND